MCSAGYGGRMSHSPHKALTRFLSLFDLLRFHIFLKNIPPTHTVSTLSCMLSIIFFSIGLRRG